MLLGVMTTRIGDWENSIAHPEKISLLAPNISFPLRIFRGLCSQKYIPGKEFTVYIMRRKIFFSPLGYTKVYHQYTYYLFTDFWKKKSKRYEGVQVEYVFRHGETWRVNEYEKKLSTRELHTDPNNNAGSSQKMTWKNKCLFIIISPREDTCTDHVFSRNSLCRSAIY